MYSFKLSQKLYHFIRMTTLNLKSSVFSVTLLPQTFHNKCITSHWIFWIDIQYHWVLIWKSIWNVFHLSTFGMKSPLSLSISILRVFTYRFSVCPITTIAKTNLIISNSGVRLFVERLTAEWTHRTSSKMSTDTLQKCSVMSFFNISKFEWLIDFNTWHDFVLFSIQNFVNFELSNFKLSNLSSTCCPSIKLSICKESFDKESFHHES